MTLFIIHRLTLQEVLLVLQITHSLVSDVSISLESSLTVKLFSSSFKNIEIIFFYFLLIFLSCIICLCKVGRSKHISHVFPLVGLFTLLPHGNYSILVPLTTAPLARFSRLSTIFISHILSHLGLINLLVLLFIF